MSVVEWFFWLSIVLVLYPYLIYPMGIGLIAILKRREQKDVETDEIDYWPDVTIIIPAYREAQSVAPKMESIRNLDYPKDKLRILWIIATHEGDDSLEPTLKALQSYPEALYILVPHRGKIYSLNQARLQVETPYTLITDADILISPHSLRVGIQHMKQNPRVVLVGGSRQLLPQGKNTPVGFSEAPYLGYEAWLGKAESQWGCALGLGGGFLLLRTSFWPEMPAGVVDDLYLNLYAGLNRFHVVFEPKIKSYEIPSASYRVEFQRKIRIAYTAFNTIRSLFSWKKALQNPLFLFFFFSHKLFRYTIAPVALLIGLLSVVGVAFKSTFYSMAATLYILAALEAFALWALATVRLPGWIALPGYFFLAHFAQLVGLWKFLRSEDPLRVWQRLPRTEIGMSHAVEHNYSTGSSTS
ncbi:MAG: glycosyltransferase [Bacteroidia bacterium]|nr:glycosyltransferase [Bacteroidia bacterium]MDW8134082.1 glycosyltransferase [Bacteroidia bacterium]